MTANPSTEPDANARWLGATLIFVALVVAVVGSLGAPLITAVARAFSVSLTAAQWTLTGPLLLGTIATPVLGRLGAGAHRRQAIVATLSVVVCGSLLTAVPPSFAWLLVGRIAQGAGLGLTPLIMGIARDHLQGKRSNSTIATLSVASTLGVGVGYPLAGLLTDSLGLSAAYGFGALMTAIALGAALRVIPDAPLGRTSTLDLEGAALLGLGLLALLLAIGQARLWLDKPAAAAMLLGTSIMLLVAWVYRERNCELPLVDLTSLRHPAVMGANASMLLGGIGMYLLLTLVTRFVQTPLETGYGFGLNVLVAGTVLVPFSVMGFIGAKAASRLGQSRSPAVVLPGSATVVLLALILFAFARGQLWLPFVVMGVLGLGVGGFSSAMPAVILEVTEAAETSSAMSFNQVVRGVGFATGSAVGGLTLGIFTPAGSGFPTNSGYTAASCLGAAIIGFTVLAALMSQRIGRLQK